MIFPIFVRGAFRDSRGLGVYWLILCLCTLKVKVKVKSLRLVGTEDCVCAGGGGGGKAGAGSLFSQEEGSKGGPLESQEIRVLLSHSCSGRGSKSLRCSHISIFLGE